MALKFKPGDEVLVKMDWLEKGKILGGIVTRVDAHSANPNRCYKVHLTEPVEWTSITPPVIVLWFTAEELELFK